jgi:hypothetical protein
MKRKSKQAMNQMMMMQETMIQQKETKEMIRQMMVEEMAAMVMVEEMAAMVEMRVSRLPLNGI